MYLWISRLFSFYPIRNYNYQYSCSVNLSFTYSCPSGYTIRPLSSPTAGPARDSRGSPASAARRCRTRSDGRTARRGATSDVAMHTMHVIFGVKTVALQGLLTLPQQRLHYTRAPPLIPIPPTHKLNGSSLGRPDVDLMFAKWAFNIVPVASGHTTLAAYICQGAHSPQLRSKAV